MWHSLEKEEIFEQLKTSETGLSEKEAKERLAKYGKNELKQSFKVHPLFIFFEQFKSLFVLILIASAIFSLLIQHYLDFSVVLAIILINGFIGFFQQYKAEKIISEMKNLLVPKVKVLRNGIVSEIFSSEVVIGDILLFSEGDKIVGDCRVIESDELQVNESVLTGESFPQIKKYSKILSDTILNDRINMVYAGTGVVGGHGKGIVVATGMDTEFGKIAKSVQKIKEGLTPLEHKINILSKKIAIGAFILTFATILLGLAKGREISEMILTGISLAISIIPEGLPAIISITLALAIKRMKKYNALVRRLPAAETLGRTTTICTDKTGTLTEEEISVSEIYCNERTIFLEGNSFLENNKKIDVKKSPDLIGLLNIGIMCNNVHLNFEKDKLNILGDSTEKAVAFAAYKAGILNKNTLQNSKRIKEYSFSSDRKMMSVIREVNGRYINYVKGSPDKILKICSKEQIKGRLFNLTEKRKKEILDNYEHMASKALRVLAFAFREVQTNFSKEQAEQDLVFVGFQGMIDKPRKEVKNSIEECKQAGIKIKMITGDSETTAIAIARMIGLESKAISGRELEKLKEKEFDQIVKEKTIFARITPELKLRIVRSLKSQNEIIAVTGDGINDILALKEADIGIAMGIRGSEVTRETADIILLDDNFQTIVNAVREGRRVYDNLKKSIRAQLSANIDELFIILTAIIFALPLPFLPLSILWMNLITDSLPSLSLSMEKEDIDIMKRKPIKPNENLLKEIYKFIIIGGILSFIISMGLFLSTYNLDLAKARTFAVASSVFSELFIVLSCRSEEKNLWKIDFFGNKFLLFSIALATILQLIAIYTPLSSLFGMKAISLIELLIVFAISSIPLIIFELTKFFKIKL